MKEPKQSKEPFCSNCGYQLTGLTESSKCPGCGKPIVEVLTRHPQLARLGKRYRSKTTIFGLPLVHVALGPTEGELRGKAKGIIAIGDIATGVFAMGGMAFGVIALGGLAIGLVAFGGGAVGLVSAFGGASAGGLAVGGGAVGVVAQGGGAVGVIADGGGAYGYLARGGDARGTYTVTPRGSSPGADKLMAKWGWLIGRQMGRPVLMIWAAIAALGVALPAGLVVLMGYIGGVRHVGRPEGST